MSAKTGIAIDDRRFKAALAEYIPTTKKDLAEIINKRSLNIAIRAIKETPKASKAEIAFELGQTATVLKTTKEGKFKKGKKIYANSKQQAVPLAVLIINSRRKKKGLPGLNGKNMAKAIRKMLGARYRSIAFIRSGWVPAIKRLAYYAKSTATTSGAKVYGRNKGSAIPAKESFFVNAIITNSTKNADEVGLKALQRAMDAEASEIISHVQKKLQASANKINAR